MIRVRVDDFPNTKDPEKDRHSLAAYREFHRCLSECIGGKRYLLGVIPKRCSVEDVLFLRNETDCVIGMHGTDHDEARLDRNGGNQFEQYLTLSHIANILMDHREPLQDAVGRGVTIYMPPRNVIDPRTAWALYHAGFTHRTGGPETAKEFRGRLNGITYLHSEPPHEYGRTDELLQRGSHAILRQMTTDVILTLHWTWETNIGLEHMRRFFAEIPTEMFGGFDDIGP